MTFEPFIITLPHFLATIQSEKNLSLHTQRAYESDLKKFQEFWKERELQENKTYTLRQAIERYIRALYHQKLSKSSIARKVSCFNTYEKYIAQSQGTRLNLRLDRPHISQKAPRSLSIADITQLLSAPPEQLDSTYPLRDSAIIALFYATGIRCSELIAIQLMDIDFENQLIRIKGRGKRDRFVPLAGKTAEKMDNYIKQERPSTEDKHEFLFLNYKNEPLTTRSVQRICASFRPLLSSKIPITPHTLRHSCAKHLLMSGTDMLQVQELLGHSTHASIEKYIPQSRNSHE